MQDATASVVTPKDHGGLRKNEPSEVGREFGSYLAAYTEAAIADMEGRGEQVPERCRSCAFRQGTYPNGCSETVATALNCVLNSEPFYCHQKVDKATGEPSDYCAGYLIGIGALETDPWQAPDVAIPRYNLLSYSLEGFQKAADE